MFWLFCRSFWVVTNNWELPWEDATIGCTIEGVILTLCFLSSLFLTALIAYDRFRMISNPMKPLVMTLAMKLYKISLCWACYCTAIHAFLLGGYDHSAGNMYCLVDLWNPFSNMWLFFTLMLPCVGFTCHAITRCTTAFATSARTPSLLLATDRTAPRKQRRR